LILFFDKKIIIDVNIDFFFYNITCGPQSKEKNTVVPTESLNK